MLTSVILRHELPDGSSHFDWMFETAVSSGDPDALELVSFRLTARPDDVTVIDLDAVRIQNHRRLYLDFEGGLPPGSTAKGTMKRLAKLECQVLKNTPTRIEVMLRVDGRWTTWFGSPVPGKTSADGHPMWSFEALRG